MRTIHQKLHLQHHYHTGKVLHHRHTSYRSVAVILLLAGTFMGGLTIMQRVTAQSLVSIYATVHVPRPQTPAVIAMPENAATIPSGDTLIAGSCPIVSPQAVVIVTIDSTDVGSAVCDANNNFGVSTSFAAGPHTIVAQVTSIDNDAGPVSGPIQVTVSPAAAKTPAPTIPAAKLTSDNSFMTSSTGRDIEWNGDISGSAKSYKLQLDWGDGTYENYDVKPGAQHLRHHYSNLAAYNVTLGLSDAAGNYQHVQFAAALSSDAFPAAAAVSAGSSSTTVKTATVVGLYGFFVTIICLAAIIRLHAIPFAYTPITLEHHHAKN